MKFLSLINIKRLAWLASCALITACVPEVRSAFSATTPAPRSVTPPRSAPAPVGLLTAAPTTNATTTASHINILILALDAVDGSFALSADQSPHPTGPQPANPQQVPDKATVPGAITPAQPGDIVPLLPGVNTPPNQGGITPAAATGQVTTGRVIVRVNAKQQAPDDRFKLEPDRPTAYPKGRKPGDITSPTSPPASNNSTIPPSGGSSLGSSSGLPGALSGVPLTGAGERTIGIAQAAASPLRRALLKSGYKDVLNITPDSATIQRALNAGNFTPRVLNTLQSSMTRVVAVSLNTSSAVSASPTGLNQAAPANGANADGANNEAAGAAVNALPQLNARLVEAMQPAILSAARIGQALNYRAVIVLAVLPRSADVDTNALNANAALAPTSFTPTSLSGMALDGHNGEAVLIPTAATAKGAAPSKGVPPANRTVPAAPLAPPKSATYALLIVDTMREIGEPLVFDERGAGDLGVNEAAAAIGASIVDKRLRAWPELPTTEKSQRVAMHFSAARTAITQGDAATAQDELNQVITLDPSRVEAHVLLGDVLQKIEPAKAAAAYRRAVDIKANDGALWAKIATSFTMGAEPSWPSSLDAAQRAIALGYDTATLRTTMATAQFGRASQFRKYNHPDRAEEAEKEARQHLDRALRMEPDNPSVARLMAGQLLGDRRYAEAVQALDRLSLLYPDDVQLQTQYAQALSGAGRRYEDTFAAWARVWKLSREKSVALDSAQYRRLSEGFDRRLESIGKGAYQLAVGVRNGAFLRETALLELTKLQEDMDATETAIKIIQQPTDRRNATNHTTRGFSAALMNQSIDNYQKYLETGQDLFFTRGYELYRQSINRLNSFRAPQTQQYAPQDQLQEPEQE